MKRINFPFVKNEMASIVPKKIGMLFAIKT